MGVVEENWPVIAPSGTASNCRPAAKSAGPLLPNRVRGERLLRQLWRASVILGWFALLGVYSGFIPVFQFAREKIVVTLRKGEIQVDGLYYYRNPWPTPMSQGMAVPFPVDGKHPPPCEVELELLPGQDASLRCFAFGATQRFELRAGAGRTVCVRLRYRQTAACRSGRYLLTTSRPWGRALESGVYRMVLDGVALRRSSYALVVREAGALGFERSNFMPEKDWEFAWSDQ
jgi:hypothetical protein